MTGGRGAYRPVVAMFSGGRASFAAAVRARARYGDAVRLLFCDVKAEDVDVYRFVQEGAAALDLPLTTVADGRTPWQVAHDERMIPNSRVPLCSRRLKHEPTRRWLDEHAPDALVVVGIGWDEAHRLPGITAGHSPREVWAPLTEPPFLDGSDLDALVRSYGIEPPRMYAHGYQHANCAGGCFRAGHAAWRHLLLDSPDLFAEHEREEQRFRDKHGDVAILRYRSGLLEGRALPLSVLRQEVEAGGDQLDLWDWGGCGCTSGEALAPAGKSDPEASANERPEGQR